MLTADLHELLHDGRVIGLAGVHAGVLRRRLLDHQSVDYCATVSFHFRSAVLCNAREECNNLLHFCYAFLVRPAQLWDS
jgi:hypothetical protein